MILIWILVDSRWNKLKNKKKRKNRKLNDISEGELIEKKINKKIFKDIIDHE